MQISIVIPCYNASKYIKETLQSVFAQTFTSWECICVDDGSTDTTAVLVESLSTFEPRLRLIRQVNQDVAIARNSGYDATNRQSDYVIFLENDDIWEPQLLEVLLSRLSARPDCLAAYVLPKYFSSQPERTTTLDSWGADRLSVRRGKAEKISLTEPTTFAEMVCGNAIITPGQVLIRRSAMELIGVFDTAREICPCSDWDYWLRLTRNGPMLLVDQMLLRYRQHTSNVSNNLSLMSRATALVAEKTIRSSYNTRQQRRLAQLGYRTQSVIAAKAKLQLAGKYFLKGQIKEAVRQAKYAARPTCNYCKSFFL